MIAVEAILVLVLFLCLELSCGHVGCDGFVVSWSRWRKTDVEKMWDYYIKVVLHAAGEGSD